MIAIEESAALLIIYPNYLYTIIIKGFYFLCAQTEKGEKYTKTQLRKNQYFFTDFRIFPSGFLEIL